MTEQDANGSENADRASRYIRHALKLVAVIRLASERDAAAEVIEAYRGLGPTWRYIEAAIDEHARERCAYEELSAAAGRRETFVREALKHAQSIANVAIERAHARGIALETADA